MNSKQASALPESIAGDQRRESSPFANAIDQVRGVTHRLWLVAVDEWGTGSFENDPASAWFFLVEEAVDPGAVIASALDRALGEADRLDSEQSCEAIAAAELSASCAGHAPTGLPDHVRFWADSHPHEPHDSEIDQAVQAVQRIRVESDLRDYWGYRGEDEAARWLRAVEDLIARLERSGAGGPVALSP